MKNKILNYLFILLPVKSWLRREVYLVCFSLLFFLTALLGVGLYPTPSRAKVISIKAAPIGTYVKLGDNLLVKANSEGLFISTNSYSYPTCTTSPTITNTNPSWCSNDSSSTSTLTASLEGIANPICTWSPTVGLSNPTSCTTLASPTSTTTYTVEINGCSSSSTITINPTPSIVTISNSGAQCGSTRTLTASGGSGGTIYYQGTTSNGTSTADTATSKTFSSSSGTVYWRALSSAGCWGDQGSGYATINAIPSAVTVNGSGNRCGTSLTLTATGGSGGNIYYQGTTSGGSSTGTPTTTAVVSTSGTYYFRARSTAGCWGNEGSGYATIISAPSTLQAMNNTCCNYMTSLQTMTLTDIRDSKTYRIRKFDDGHCWMIDNLAYGSCTASSWGNSSTVGYCRNNPGSTTYGYLYNWAMALSVCPSPWYLPPNSGAGSFYNLHAIYGSPLPNNFWVNSTYWNGIYSGNCIPETGELSNQNYHGPYWSSTQTNNSYTYTLLFVSGDDELQTSSIRNKANGFAVRCVL